MRMLFLAEKTDAHDAVLAFSHRWVKEFAMHAEKITVICLEKGVVDLPNNVTVYSLGKEEGKGRITYIWRLFSYIWKYRKDYDVVFVHMIVEYVLLGGLLWKLLKKPIGMWYAHGTVSTRLKLSEKLVDTIFTSTKSGCRIESKKIQVLHQGIDIDGLPLMAREKENEVFELITIGRISPVKGYELLIDATEALKKKGSAIHASIIGGPGNRDQQQYLDKLKKMVEEKGLQQDVSFLGTIPNKDISPYLQKSDLFVNMSSTGSLDKAMLEAMATGIPMITCNEAVKEVLGTHTDLLMYPKHDRDAFIAKIEDIMDIPFTERVSLGKELRQIVVEKHSVTPLIKKMYTSLNSLL